MATKNVTRRCPFHGCEAKIAAEVFACRKHWFSLSHDERTIIYESYYRYTADRIGVDELRRQQQVVLGNRGDAARGDQS